MKAFKNLLIFYFLIFVVSIITQGCCTKTYNITGIRDIEVKDFNNNPIDTISGEFVILMDLLSPIVYNSNELNLINSAYGTSCGHEFTNSINESTISLHCDQTFKIQNVEIEPSVNFVDNTGIIAESYKFRGNASIGITVDSTFINIATFDEGIHKFTVEAVTSNGLTLTDSIEVYVSF